MRNLLRWTGRLALGALGLVVLCLAGLLAAIWWTLPGRDGTLQVAGLSAPVEIALDAHGIPRIAAANDEDAWTALGWLHARDRMFQMETMRRGAAGRLAELTGAPALRVDRFMRLLGLERRAEADLAGLPADTRRALEAYAAGVNAWIAARGRFAGPEFVLLGAPDPWRPVDSLLWGKVMGLWLAGNFRTELDRARLAAILPPERLADLWPEDRSPGRPDAPLMTARAAAGPDAVAAPALAGLEGLAAALPRFPGDAPLPSLASNSWAVAPGRSATGAPLLATDPHLGYQAPILWYLARVELPGGRVLAGATAPGVPGIVIGRNDRLAWGFTTTHADTQDVFVERLAGPDAYETPDGPRPFAVREEVINVRFGAPVTMRVRETRHGPVLSDLDAPQGRADGTVLAVAMASLAPGDSAAAGLLALNGARDIAQAREAARLITSPVQNLMLADADGRIAMVVTGRVPLRRAGDGSAPMPGWDGRSDWTGFVPFEDLPHVATPASGLLANANNRIAPPGHPAFLGRDWYGDWRFRRIGEVLEGATSHAPAGFAALQADRVSLFAREALPAFRAMPRPAGTAGAALDLLADWQGEMEGARPQPLLFHATLGRFARLLLARAGVAEDAWRPSPEFLRRVLTVPETGLAWCGAGGCGPLLAEALTRAIADLAPAHGADPASWRWAAAQPAIFEHPVLRFVPGLGALTRIAVPSGGDGETVNRAGLRPERDGVFGNVHGAGFRGVFDLADPDGAHLVIATGQSGHPMSRHWADLLPFWRDGALLRIGALAGAPSGRLRLVP
ncbi:penicillin acylase family protein [Roseomonas sp. PWR1]|uniref:Penicillin acylase family protein n=1 Tax=Roseomonas nitratireducens TaxID=2820810 RepID=A0ABS4AP63_9PROT|nr:penicillin acylase family protein [Neoroseomonas nitratireducens]MBP0463150.1 penicillin acylase family protein [Neoroseomonas nitratireducens]